MSEIKEKNKFTKEDFYKLFIQRLMELVSYDSEDMDLIANSFSSAQGKRVSYAGTSFFEQLERLNPDIASIVEFAHDQATSTLQKIYGQSDLFNILKQPGTQSEGQQLAHMLNEAIYEKLYGNH